MLPARPEPGLPPLLDPGKYVCIPPGLRCRGTQAQGDPEALSQMAS